MEQVTYLAALTAGVLSFISPCVLPLVPPYISYMTGISVDQLRQGEAAHTGGVERLAFIHSLSFVLGFALVFMALGASATAAGRVLLEYIDLLAKVGGVLVVIMGLHYMGVFRIGLLNMEAHFTVGAKRRGPLGSFLMGLSFAFGWTPCVGPILAAILAVAGTQETITEGVLLLGIYSAGLGLPFLIAGVAINTFFGFFARIRRHLHRVEQLSGLLLVGVGVLIFLGDLSRLSTWLLQLFPRLAEIG